MYWALTGAGNSCFTMDVASLLPSNTCLTNKRSIGLQRKITAYFNHWKHLKSVYHVKLNRTWRKQWNVCTFLTKNHSTLHCIDCRLHFRYVNSYHKVGVVVIYTDRYIYPNYDRDQFQCPWYNRLLSITLLLVYSGRY